MAQLVKPVQYVQESLTFEKILTATSVPSNTNPYPRLTLPSPFVRQHGNKIRLSAVLQNEATREKWTVEIVVRHPQKNPQVMFYGGGWKGFAASNGLVAGDRLTFTLTGMSEFGVSISDNAEALPIPWPRKRSKRARFSQRLTAKAPGRNPRQVRTVKKPKHTSVPDPKLGELRLKCTSEEEEVTDSAFSKRLPLSISPLKRYRGKDPGVSMVVYRQELALVTSFNRSTSSPWNAIERKKNHAQKNLTRSDHVSKKNQEASLPSFVKQLPTQHFQRMEIPCKFYRTYGSRLNADVKLQGISDGSPVRDVACCLRNDGKNLRVDLTDGWKKFNSENSLAAGQKFVFTLTAESFFEGGVEGKFLATFEIGMWDGPCS